MGGDTSRSQRPGRPDGAPIWLIAAVGLLFAVKLGVTFTLAPVGDEAYYWVWSLRPDWSYFDHPPLNAWLLALSRMIAGDTLFALRLPPLMASLVSLWILWLWAGKLSPEDRSRHFWVGALLLVSTPGLFATMILVFPDYLIVTLLLGAGYLFTCFLSEEQQDVHSSIRLYGGAVLLGLAALAKYNVALFGFGLAFAILLHPAYRLHLRNPHLYVAGLLVIAMQLPMLAWNAGHEQASFMFHWDERWSGGSLVSRPAQPWYLVFVLESILFYTFPAATWALIRLFSRGGEDRFEKAARTLALAVFLTSTLVMSVAGLYVRIFLYWNVIAYVLLLAVAPLFIRSRWLVGAQSVLGGVVVLVFAFNFVVVPIGPYFQGSSDWDSVVTYGWSDVTGHGRELVAEYGPDFVGGTRYTLTSQFAFATGVTAVTDLTERHTQFDYWEHPKIVPGATALILAADAFPISRVSAQFDNVEEVAAIPVERFGKRLNTFRIYYGTGYQPEGDGSKAE